ncbi:MAG: hypothetical protein JW727_06385 [Candidatus Aenigmarchaeota archaeon]|nr:hypothetical protein [Candidatus Aenigmarchaeota archaeon]
MLSGNASIYLALGVRTENNPEVYIEGSPEVLKVSKKKGPNFDSSIFDGRFV